MSKPLENLDELLKSHKLTQEDYEHIIKILGRDPNLVELGIFSAMWSEHCSYNLVKIYLNGFSKPKAPMGYFQGALGEELPWGL